jgi:hypothetical protein
MNTSYFTINISLNLLHDIEPQKYIWFFFTKIFFKCEWNDSHALVVRNNEDDDSAQISGGNVAFSEIYVSVKLLAY